MSYRLVAVKKNTKAEIDRLAKELKLNKYEVVEMALKLLKSKSGKCIVEVSPDTYKELMEIKQVLLLRDDDEVIRALLRIPKIIYNDDLRLCDALRPLDELEEKIRKREESD